MLGERPLYKCRTGAGPRSGDLTVNDWSVSNMVRVTKEKTWRGDLPAVNVCVCVII